jgi:basic amino acid/polyamine antiporter, APA family
VTQFGLPQVEVVGWTIDLNPPKDKALFDMLTDFAMFGAVIFETMAVATIFVFRRTLPGAARPYRCWGYPWVPAVYVVILASVAVNTLINQRIEAAVGLGFIAMGIVVYAVFLRHRSQPLPAKALAQ